MTEPSNEKLKRATLKLLAYCESNEWAGYDPYDALNSRIFTAVPALDARIPRLVLTQALKRLPINLRPLLAIPKKQNSKGLALCLSALIKLLPLDIADGRKIEANIEGLIESIEALRSPGKEYFSWGYSFPWQTRTKVVPAGTSNLVCTVFVANALLDAYDWRGSAKCLSMGLSAAEYLLIELYWAKGSTAGFGYPLPSMRNQVYNANLLGAALLSRAYSYTKDKRYLTSAMNVARYSCRKQRPDGSWLYGESPSQSWIDNFHTGFNLCALKSLSESASTHEFDSAIRTGYEFYRSHFLGADGTARYFHDRTYPVDIHSVAQSVITLIAFRDLGSENLAMAHQVLDWALSKMWDERGFFYYRMHRSHVNKISYMRWSQAWMLLAMSELLKASKSRISEDSNLAGAVPRVNG
jgi:hypothetical protein